MPYVMQSRTSFQMACDRQTLGPVYMEKSCSGWKGHSPTRATLAKPTFHTFPTNVAVTVYIKNKILARLGE